MLPAWGLQASTVTIAAACMEFLLSPGASHHRRHNREHADAVLHMVLPSCIFPEALRLGFPLVVFVASGTAFTSAPRADYAPITRRLRPSSRASLASISATETLLAAVPCVLRELLHIFPTQNGHFLQKSPNLALKRNAGGPFWPQTYTFPTKNQHF